MDRVNFSVVILAFNDADMLARLLELLAEVEDIVVVDSSTSDQVRRICNLNQVRYYFNNFINQAIQLNWAIDNIEFQNKWILRLDTDEIVTKALLNELNEYALSDRPIVGYIDRKMVWMGKLLRFSAPRPLYIARFWKKGFARFAEVTEEYLEHSCPRVYMRNKFFEFNTNNSINYFVKKHLITGEQEVVEKNDNFSRVEGKLFGDRHERVRWVKQKVYNRIPNFFGPLLYFLYRYILRLGFLDGNAGFSFCFFQALWYRVYIQQRHYERDNAHWFEVDKHNGRNF